MGLVAVDGRRLGGDGLQLRISQSLDIVGTVGGQSHVYVINCIRVLKRARNWNMEFQLEPNLTGAHFPYSVGLLHPGQMLAQ